MMFENFDTDKFVRWAKETLRHKEVYLVLFLIGKPPMNKKQIEQELGLAHSTLEGYVTRLLEIGILYVYSVEKSGVKYHLMLPENIY